VKIKRLAIRFITGSAIFLWKRLVDERFASLRIMDSTSVPKTEQAVMARTTRTHIPQHALIMTKT
jgi:hypothetical protein